MPSGMPQMPEPAEVAPDARRLLRMAKKVALATIDRITGAPFISLTGVATKMDGTPILLLSALARHTRNIAADARASLLFECTGQTRPGADPAGGPVNPLTENRISLTGTITQTGDLECQRRFQAHQPKSFYSGFGDFAFYRMVLETAHYIGGFGVALGLKAPELLLNSGEFRQLLAAEEDILAHMNQDHGDAVELYATMLLGAAPGRWMLSAIDPEGCTLACRARQLRLDFPHAITSPEEARQVLAALAEKARRA